MLISAQFLIGNACLFCDMTMLNRAEFDVTMPKVHTVAPLSSAYTYSIRMTLLPKGRVPKGCEGVACK